jgi:hypothetical protein
MPWSYVNGTFKYRAAVQPTVTAPAVYDTTRVSGDPSLVLGDWVEHTDLPNALSISFKHFNIEKAHPHIQAAQENSVRVAGIVSSAAANNTYDVAGSGTAMAWVLEPIKTKLPLSGVYSRSINGVASGQVVILYNERDNSFTMASTRDSDLELLRLRFDALTNT